MGRVFEKQIKTIEDQRKKPVVALETLKPKELKATEDKSDDNEKHLKYKEVLDELSNERMGETYNISKEIDFNHLTYRFKGSNIAPMNFVKFKGPMHIYNEIKNGNVSIKKIEEDQKKLRSKLNEITTGNLQEIFITQGKKLSNYIMIMLKLYLKLYIKNRKQDLKCQHLNKCFKDYQ